MCHFLLHEMFFTQMTYMGLFVLDCVPGAEVSCSKWGKNKICGYYEGWLHTNKMI